MQLTALVESPDHVCCRYRLEAFRPLLKQAGHGLRLHCWPRHWYGWFGLSCELRMADVVIVQRRLLAAWQLYLVRQAARRLLFDFDDAVFLRDSYASRGLFSRRRQRRFAALVRVADGVMAGNSFLAGQAAMSAPGRPIQVVPTCVDPEAYPVALHRREGGGVQLAWVGSSSTLRGLEQIRPLLENLGRRWPGLCLKMICDRFLTLDSLPVVACAWSQEREAAELAAADIGISWIPNDLWSRGKCGLKVLQYMAAGLPVVANPVGVQAELVRDGETGYLARTREEWIAAIGRLASDANLRRRLGQAGRQLVEQEYSLAAGAEQWLAVLQRLENQKEVA